MSTTKNAITVQCCKCKKIRVGTSWKAITLEQGTKVSHAYCPECMAATMSDIDSFFAKNRGTEVAATM